MPFVAGEDSEDSEEEAVEEVVEEEQVVESRSIDPEAALPRPVPTREESRPKEAPHATAGSTSKRRDEARRKVGASVETERAVDLKVLISRSETLKRHKKLVKRAASGIDEWEKQLKRDTERWFGVDTSLNSIHSMIKGALSDTQEARDAMKRCSALAAARK